DAIHGLTHRIEHADVDASVLAVTAEHVVAHVGQVGVQVAAHESADSGYEGAHPSSLSRGIGTGPQHRRRTRPTSTPRPAPDPVRRARRARWCPPADR